MSKTSNQQRIAVLNIWLNDLKKNPNHRKRESKKQAHWIKEILDED
jgi:hypothetical protein